MSEVCCYADERFYLKVQILMSFTIIIGLRCPEFIMPFAADPPRRRYEPKESGGAGAASENFGGSRI